MPEERATGLSAARVVLWVTNHPAPYRYPVWRHLSQTSRLEVAYLGGARDHPWETRAEGSFAQVQVSGISGVRRLVKRRDAQVLGSWHTFACALLLVAGRLNGTPTVTFYESTPSTHRHRRGPIAWMRRLFFAWSDALLTVGPTSTQGVLLSGARPERVLEARNAADVSRFADVRARTKSLKEYDVLYVGQLVPRKNVRSALEAWSCVRLPGEQFAVVGDGVEELALRTLVCELGLQEQVTFLGRLDGEGLDAMYAASRTLVLPSVEEVFGLVVNEALAAGCHAVVSERAGVAANVRGMAGVYLAPPTVDGLATAIVASRDDWRGPVTNPEILKHSPERLATSARDAIMLAQRVAQGRSGCRRRAYTRDSSRLALVTSTYELNHVALWRAIAEERSLDVFCLVKDEPNRGCDLGSVNAGEAAVRRLGVERWPSRCGVVYRPSRRIPAALIASGADVVVLDGSESPAFLHAVRAAHKQGRAVVASYPSATAPHCRKRDVVPRMRRQFLCAVDAVLTTGHASTEVILGLGVAAERIVTGVNPVDTERAAQAVLRVVEIARESANHRRAVIA
jgi:glycosyltransferase involved in cell wall biosynthesis